MTLEPNHRMPTAFGPAPGPRNVPADAPAPSGPARQSVASFTAEVRPAALEGLLPERVEVRVPALRVRLVTFENLHWFAGRGYDALSVSVPVRYSAPAGPVDADYLLVMWENDADPIITGRDELGFPKLFADIDVARSVNWLRAQASWDHTTFFRAELHDFRTADPVTSTVPVLTHRYCPAVGKLSAADVDYLTLSTPGPAPTVTYSAVASGTFTFEPVTWNDVPLQYPVINALAAIDVVSVGPASLVCSEIDVTNRRPVEGPAYGSGDRRPGFDRRP